MRHRINDFCCGKDCRGYGRHNRLLFRKITHRYETVRLGKNPSRSDLPCNRTSRMIPNVMSPARVAHAPRWYTVLARVCAVTFVGTLLSFAVILLFAILGTVIVAALKGVHPDMRIAYRHIAVPMALVVGSVVFVLAVMMEIRHFRQAKALSSIERMG